MGVPRLACAVAFVVLAMFCDVTAHGQPVATQGTAKAQPGRPRTRLLIDLGVAYFAPLGGWAQHALTKTRPGLDLAQFQAGPTASLMVGAAGLLGGKWELALRGDYTWLRTSDWEDFVAADGGRVLTSASVASAGLHVGRDLRAELHFPLLVYGGPAIFFPSGREDFASVDRSYEYTFLTTSYALRAGAAVVWRPDPLFVLALTVEGVIGTSIVQYPGDERALLGALVALRARLEDEVGR